MQKPMRYCSQCHSSYPTDERFCPKDGAAIVEDTATPHPLIGKTLSGRYLVRRRIGKGGMGEVFEADHIGLDKRVAIKFLLDKFNTDREVLMRFHREARLASKIGHDNIIDITDIGEDDEGRAYIVMELLEGLDLGQVLQRSGPMHVHRAVHLIRQICRGLAAAHDKQIVHRDMKPENVFLTQRDDRLDVVKIMDFGISKVIDAHDSKVRLTQTGAVVGTPVYMAPEQAMGDEVDHRCDVYAVGVMLFELLCGRPPFEGTTYLSLVTQHINAAPPNPRTLRPDIPPSVEKLILDALEKDPAKRVPTIRAFEQRLPTVPQLTPSMVDAPQPVHTESPQPAAYAAPTAMPTRTFKRSYRLPILLVGIAAAAAIAMIAFGYYTSRDSVKQTAQQVVTPPAPVTIDAGTVVAEPLANAAMGAVEIDSVPAGADVYFDDEHKGVTPIRLDDVTPGVHRVRLERRKYETLEAQKQVRAGYNETFFGALAPKRSGGTSRVKPAGPATHTEPEPKPPTVKPIPIDPKVQPAPNPPPGPRPGPKPGDPDHKPNPFDKDRKPNPFAD